MAVMDTNQQHSNERTIAELAALADRWRAGRHERQERTHLERGDFDAISRTGFLRSVVPADQGGTWLSAAKSVGPISTMLRTLAAADPSVALVSSMHPAVLAFWLTSSTGDGPEWTSQRQAVLATPLSGQRWGTITSEPGSGGDILKTQAVATSIDRPQSLPGRTYAITGVKHFGSGMGITDWMITTAVPAGEDEPALFILDVGGRPWDGTAGLTLTDEWDGAGMAATQSHGMRLDGVPAVRFGLHRPLSEVTGRATPFVLTLFSAVLVGILDEAIAVARERLQGRREALRPYERVEWASAERQHWLAQQALAGSLAAVESDDPTRGLHGALRAKQSIAELAEDMLTSLGRVLGGGTFARRSPFAHWYEDVRALGFLRPPWGLAHDQLFDTSW